MRSLLFSFTGRTLVLALLVIVLISGCRKKKRKTDIVMIADITAEAPDIAKRIYDNELVEVVRVMLEPGEKLPRHYGGQRVVYSLSDYQLQFRLDDDDEAIVRTWTEGYTEWLEDNPPKVTNSGPGKAEYLVVKRKGTDLPVMSIDPRRDLRTLADESSVLLLDEEKVRVIEVNLLPGEKVEHYRVPPGIVYALNSYQVRMKEEGQSAQENQIQVGQVVWHGSKPTTIENIGDNNAQFLMVGLKQ